MEILTKIKKNKNILCLIKPKKKFLSKHEYLINENIIF